MKLSRRTKPSVAVAEMSAREIKRILNQLGSLVRKVGYSGGWTGVMADDCGSRRLLHVCLLGESILGQWPEAWP